MNNIVQLTRIGTLNWHSVDRCDPRPELVNLDHMSNVEYMSCTGLAVWRGENSCAIYRETMEELDRLRAQPVALDLAARE